MKKNNNNELGPIRVGPKYSNFLKLGKAQISLKLGRLELGKAEFFMKLGNLELGKAELFLKLG